MFLMEENCINFGNCCYVIFTPEEILDNYRSVLCYFGISTKDEELDLPSLLDSLITQVSFQTAVYCWVCQMLHETSFQNRASELLWH